MKIVSLFPAGSEIICNLGLSDNLVAVSHECDFPPLLNKKIRDSNLPEDIRIGAIVRKDQVIIPKSNFIFEKDDLVVFLAKREQLKEVESIFSVSSI